MKQYKMSAFPLTLLFTTFCCVITMAVEIPSSIGGFFNIGDCFCMFAGLIVGPYYGFAAAGVGSALADLFLGYVYYSPITFILKGALALLTALMYREMGRTKILTRLDLLKITGIAEGIMVVGYLLYECMWVGWTGFSNVWINLLQALTGIVITVVFYPAVLKLFKED